MRSALLFALALAFPVPPPADTLPPNYERSILEGRQQEARALTSPDSWLSLVALQPLTNGNVSVGTAPDNNLRLEHGLPHAFTLHVDAGKVTFAAVDAAVTLGGTHQQVGNSVPAGEAETDALKWSSLYAYVIQRTGNQTYLRVGDPDSPNLRHFHGLNFYPVNPAYRITARWVPYTTPHSIHMGTVLGTMLVVPSPGYVEFVVDGQTVHLDAMGGEKQISLSFRDGTYKTTTYGAGREVQADLPSHGLNAPGTVVIDFNRAGNWPCAYTQYGTCPLPPEQNRFAAVIPAGEKRYHD